MNITLINKNHDAIKTCLTSQGFIADKIIHLFDNVYQVIISHEENIFMIKNRLIELELLSGITIEEIYGLFSYNMLFCIIRVDIEERRDSDAEAGKKQCDCHALEKAGCD